MIKFCYHPGTDSLVECRPFTTHGQGLRYLLGNVRDYDNWVRLIVFPEYKRVYFRFFDPTGRYWETGLIDDAAQDLSFSACCKAMVTLIAAGHARKNWKVLWWDTDQVVRPEMVKI